MKPLPVTLWRTFSRGRCGTYAWSEFIDFVKNPEVVRDKTSVAGFSLASFEGDRRTLARVEKVYALTLDFDGGDTKIEDAPSLLPGTCGVAYTTFSHSITWPKLRVIYPLSRPVDALEYEKLWIWASDKIVREGRILDESARDASRFWYLPSHAPGAPYEWRELDGRPLDVEPAMKWAVASASRPFPGRMPIARPIAPCPRSDIDCAASESFFGRAFALAGLAFEPLDTGALPVVCPWGSAHTSGTDGDTSTVILPPTTGAKWGLFHCAHAHCAKRTTLDLLDVLDPSMLEAARREHGTGLVRARVRAGCVQRLEAFEEMPPLDRFILRCYPHVGPPLIWTVKLNSRAHVEGLESLPLMALRGRRVDLALRGRREITWGRLTPETV